MSSTASRSRVESSRGRHDDQLDAIALARLVGPKVTVGEMEMVAPEGQDGFGRW